MHSYIHRIFVYHNYVKSNFEIDISNEDKEGFRNLILTGKNGSGKTTLLKAIHKELFRYKAGILPSNTYYNLLVGSTKNEVLKQMKKMVPSNPKVEIQFGKESDFINEDLLVIYIPTQRLNEFKAASREGKLDLKKALEDQSKKIGELKGVNIEIENAQELVSASESKLISRRLKAEEYENKLDVFKKSGDADSIIEITKDLQYERVKIAEVVNELDKRKVYLNEVLDSSSLQNPYISLSEHFLQYLVDIREKQAYAIADEETEEIAFYKDFFSRLEKLFRKLYEDSSLKLKHSFKQNKFYFEFADSIIADFNQIADGFKSVLVILAEILLQKEAFKVAKDMDDDPTGIVLIDELEAHLHLSIQEKILPVLTDFFPKLQFIVTTHSPQICASDENSYVYDISTDHLEKDYLGGISYDVLSKSHFGLSSEYSLHVTSLLNKAKGLMNKKEYSSAEREELLRLQEKLSNLSPELAYELILFNEKIKKNG